MLVDNASSVISEILYIFVNVNQINHWYFSNQTSRYPVKTAYFLYFLLLW